MTWYMNIIRQFITPPWERVTRCPRDTHIIRHVIQIIISFVHQVIIVRDATWFLSCHSSFDEVGEA
ncbi:hypothetical protein NC653_016735 [Populus alba x Populus x berolinensis]|uniref:Uncharacterized protein n=1 Tax=Populus alba x Populus x berolinensis TaxID=444605 RepID=A0AAD6QNL7_9ROSI|nr:hypothetical protein NC653_016735 [Populus alba x Populus x berolinensis]